MAPTHLIVLTPSLGRVSLGYRDTFARVMLECARRDVKLSVSDATDPGQLVHARNVLLAAAVDSDATHAMWWDADVAFEPAALFDLLERPEAMICRPYPMRAVDLDAVADALHDVSPHHPVSTLPDAHELKIAGQRWTTILEYDNGKPIWSEDGALVRVGHCGFGWVLHKLERLRAFAEDVAYLPGPYLEKDWRDRNVAHGFDLVLNEHGARCGEDVSFCARWRDSGGKIWAAPDRPIQNGDHGGRFADYLEAHGLARKG